MGATGSERTHLIVIRGDAGSGKSTLGRRIRLALDRPTALVEQDYFRWDLLNGGTKQQRSQHAISLIDGMVRTALDQGYVVIVEGVFNLRDSEAMLRSLYEDHRGQSLFLQFDIGLEATIERHRQRPDKQNLFTEDEFISWYDGWQPLTFVEEERLAVDDKIDDIVQRVVARLS